MNNKIEGMLKNSSIDHSAYLVLAKAFNELDIENKQLKEENKNLNYIVDRYTTKSNGLSMYFRGLFDLDLPKIRSRIRKDLSNLYDFQCKVESRNVGESINGN